MPDKQADYTSMIQYVAALPGYDVLLYDPAEKTFTRQAVVSWAILHGDEDFICAQPITLMSWSINDDRCVETPNGEVVCDDRVWTDAQEWLAEMKANDGVPLASEDIERVRNMPPDRTGPVLALDSFRDRFKGQ